MVGICALLSHPISGMINGKRAHERTGVVLALSIYSHDHEKSRDDDDDGRSSSSCSSFVVFGSFINH